MKYAKEFLSRIWVSILLLIILGIYHFITKQDVDFEYYLLTAILGFIFLTWHSIYEQEKYYKNLIVKMETDHSYHNANLTLLKDKFNKFRENFIEEYRSAKERREIVASLYRGQNEAILATDFYTSKNNRHRFDDEDVALPLYKGKDCRTNYDRIVSVNSIEDKKWVRNQIKESCNPNFNLYIIENFPDNLLMPNFVLVKNNKQNKIFISYPADLNEGGFGFLSSSFAFSNGVYEYLKKLKEIATPAQECLKNWGMLDRQ